MPRHQLGYSVSLLLVLLRKRLAQFDAAGGEDLVAFGRIHPDKGTHTAIEIARRAGRRSGP